MTTALATHPRIELPGKMQFGFETGGPKHKFPVYVNSGAEFISLNVLMKVYKTSEEYHAEIHKINDRWMKLLLASGEESNRCVASISDSYAGQDKLLKDQGREATITTIVIGILMVLVIVLAVSLLLVVTIL